MAEDRTELTVGYLVKRVQQALRRNCDAALRPTGLSMAQYAVLRALADHPSASAAQLARLCFVTRQSLQDVLAGLRADGLVRDAAEQGGGRAVALELTAVGRRRLAAGHRAVLAVDVAMVEDLPEGAQTQLAQWLRSCAERLER
ncbi:MarR family winged helix-turn-helix transcriptional regulator [Mycobacterium sp. NPDC003323]